MDSFALEIQCALTGKSGLTYVIIVNYGKS